MGVWLEHKGDYDVPEHMAAEFAQEIRANMARVQDEIANQTWDAFCAHLWYRQYIVILSNFLNPRARVRYV